MMRTMLLLLPALLLFGCCGPSSDSSSSFCPYGTYGETCTELCDKARGTQFDTPNCFSGCMDAVRQQGLGDATTCCRRTMRQGCNAVCTSQIERLRNQYGSDFEPGEEAQMLEECNGECLGLSQIGVDVDSVCDVITEQFDFGWEED